MSERLRSSPKNSKRNRKSRASVKLLVDLRRREVPKFLRDQGCIPALAEVLDELDRDRRKLTSIHGANLVFVRNGKPISKNTLRKAFDAGKKAAGIKDFHFDDFRHCAVTRWTLAGIPEELRKLAAGHSRGGIH